MTNWTDGYVTDVQYTSGFYREMAPAFLAYTSQVLGKRTVVDLDSGFTYCELGCGQGFGANLLAAANPKGRFYAYDFNPGQIANANALAAEAGLENIGFAEESFESLAAKPDGALPRFDFISLHGIYSWISEANRHAIVRFLARQLRPGGIVYISYNALPGWAPMMPMQRLMREYALRHPARSDLQVDAALAFVKVVKEAGARYFTNNPGATARLDKLPQNNKNYLAHEYLHEHWFPLYHADVVRELTEAKLHYVGSAFVFDNIEAIAVPEGMRELCSQVKDPIMLETVRDFAVNRQFRRDIFIRGATSMTNIETRSALQGLRFDLSVPREKASHTFKTSIGEAKGDASVYDPILDALAEQPRSLAELAGLDALKDQSFGAVSQAMAMLTGATEAHPVIAEAHAQGTEQARAFNAAVARRVIVGENLHFFAAPALGSGIGASFPEMAAYQLLAGGAELSIAQLVEQIWASMRHVGRRMVKDGKALQGEQENLNELRQQLDIFVAQKLPLWKRLGII